MHRRRQISKFLKILIAVFLYTIAYIIITFLLSPKPIYNFVGDDIRVGDKFILMFLMGSSPAFSDPDGADVFRLRRCLTCFITNNKGFIPISEYDAVVVQGETKNLAEMYPEKLYIMEVNKKCLSRKLVGCDVEPKFTSFATREVFGVCELCQYLHEKRRNKN